MKNIQNLSSLFILAVTAICTTTALAGFVDQTATFVPGGIIAGSDNVCLVDFNNDGYVDFNNDRHLYRSNGGTNFTYVGSAGGSYVWGDYNNDGLLDRFIWIGNGYLQRLNNTSGTSFSTYHDNSVMPILPPVVIDGVSYYDGGNRQGACWGDWNNDGWLDFYVSGYELDRDDPSGFPDAVLMNNAGSSFSMTVLNSTTNNRSRGVTACDFDQDGDQDIYVSCYRLRENNLWLNDGNGNFTDVATARGVAGEGTAYNDRGHTIGSCWGDFNNDGYFDLFIGNFAHPDLSQDRPMMMQNMGPAGGYSFVNRWTIEGTDYQESYCTPMFADYDNDGDLDLFFTTIYAVGSGGAIDNSRLWRNDGNWNFTDVTILEGLPSDLGETAGAAWGDINNDGFPDLITNNRLFINQGNANHWLKVRLAGDGVTVNRAAIGAQVRISLPGQTLVRQVEGGSGKGSQNELTLHFGVGASTQPVDLEITWPDGAVQIVEDVALNQTVSIAAPAAMAVSTAALTPACERASNAASQSFTVQSSSLQPMNFTVSDDAAWLTLSPLSGSCLEGEARTIQVDYDTSLLDAGTYNAIITVTSADVTNTPQTVTVSLTVEPQTGDLPIIEPFEEYAAGISLHGISGWTGTPGDGTVLALACTAATPPGFPLPEEAHTKVLQNGDEMMRTVNGTEGQSVNVDFMVKAVRNESLPVVPGGTSQAGFSVDSNGVLHVLHMYNDGGVWSQRWSPFDLPPVGEDQWLRISVTMDYSSSPSGDTFFSPRINGSLCPTPYGCKAPDNLTSPGPWYMCANSPGLGGGGGTRAISALKLEGRGWLDDVAITTGAFAHTGATTTNGVPLAWFDSWGIARLPDTDYDGDGFVTADEYAAGTDPADRESSFRIIDTWIANERFYIKFLGNDSGADTPYTMERTANGISSGWSVRDSAVPRAIAPAMTNIWSEPVQPDGPALYRLKATAAP